MRSTYRGAANIFSFLASAVLPGLLAIYATSLYSRHFSPDQYGRYSLILAVCAPILVLASQWLAQSTSRFYHELAAQSQERRIGQVVSITNLFFVVIVTTSILFFMIAGHASKEDLIYYSSGGAYLLTSIVLTNISSYMVYSGKHHIYNLTMTLSSFISFLLTVAMLYLSDLGISSLLFGVSLSNMLAILAFYNVTKINILPSKIDVESKTLLKQFFNYGIPLSFWMLMYTVINISDRYILQYFLGSDEVGRYSIHYSLVSLPFLAINSPMVNIYSPKIMKAAAMNDKLLVQSYIRDASNVYVLLGLLAMGLAYRFGDTIPYIIIDRKYEIEKSFYLSVIAGFCIWNIAMFWHKPMEIAKNTKTMFYYVSIAAAANVLLNIIFIPRYGINAAAISTLISFCIYSLLIFTANKKISGLIFDIRNVIFCILSSVTTILLSKSFPMPFADTTSVTGSIFAIVIFSLVYLLFYFALGRFYSMVSDKILKGKEKKYA